MIESVDVQKRIMVEEIKDDLILDLMVQDRTSSQGLKFLMEKYQKPLYHHIRGMMGNHTDTNDVLQETFIKAYRNISGFQRKSKLYSWLYRIATNESITFINREKKKATSPLEPEYDNPNLSAEQYFDAERGQAILAEAIMTLPEKQRLVFHMKYYDHMTYADISRKLKTSEGALKASFHHAVKKIERFIRNKIDKITR